MNHDDYFHLIEDYMIGEIPGGLPKEVLPYFRGHKERFELSLDMFDEHLSDTWIESVLDVGTGFPFVSYYFHLTRGAAVEVAGMEKPEKLPPWTGSVFLNLNIMDKIPPADLIICTECLEHVPRRHDEVLGALCEAAAEALFISVPMSGVGCDGHNLDLEKDFTKIHDQHLKEYSPGTIGVLKDRVEGHGFSLIRETVTSTSLYKGPINHLLFKRGARV